jgi:CHAT domain-containing protein
VAGTVARQLLRNGVKAVIVAGWAVDDIAGLAFADTLYRRLLEGHPLGEAVRRARLDAHEAGGTNQLVYSSNGVGTCNAV